MAHDKQSLLAVHTAVLLFALSGLFAKWLLLPAIVIVCARALFASLTLIFIIRFVKKQSLEINRSMVWPLLATGVVLAIHWVSFFQAIQVSTVAIGLITFASFPLFVSLFEPYFFKEAFELKTVFQALLTLLGISLVLPFDAIDYSVLNGMLWGVISAITFALLTLLNRKFVVQHSATKVSLYQNGVAGLLLLPLALISPPEISNYQWQLLFVLGVIFTALSHTLFNHALKKIKAQTASIAVSLEPIYAIIAAYLFLGETLTSLMMLGGLIVILTNIWVLRVNEQKS
ncbi:DMT family transporter [Thalassotalea piscium]|uniref:Drug/metabolite transporter (DMT)-like permease n=1 Tax=Thalassotalea piscium TaxID=1230533 RepID=A0A7X0TSX9_9GAMM|nr:DMT family transporter [Thalassotalea piscium]MBB6542608.1 drug/metabolite transporter (DMT)-like permease [Thalassotalea piscium]